MNFKNIGLITFLISFVAAVVFGYLYFNEKFNHATDNQLNFQRYNGLQDQMNQKADSVQTLSIQVSDLNSQIDKERAKKGYWMAVASEYRAFIDSMKLSGEGGSSSGEDSSGIYYRVKFDGKKYFVSYVGETKYYPQSKSSIWNLVLAFDTIDIVSDLYKDTDNLWKIRTVSNTSGVKIKTYSSIDSTLFASIISESALSMVEPSTDWGILGQLAISKILPNTVDGAVGGYYGGITGKYFIKEKSFWVDVTGKFSIKNFKFGGR
jgi:cell division protein FtsB